MESTVDSEKCVSVTVDLFHPLVSNEKYNKLEEVHIYQC